MLHPVICAVCGREAPANTPEEEAKAIADVARLFPGEDYRAMDRVCDECYEKVRPENNPVQYAQYLSQTGSRIAADN
jgi:hypothetical protein